MRRVIRILLYSLLALVMVIWIALGLFRPEYLKAPLSGWIERQTGLPLSIGHIEFNPFFPNVLLAEQVRLGDLLSADKIYIEVATGSWKDRRLELAHLDVINANIKLQADQPLPDLPLQDLKIRDANLERLNFSSPDLKLGGANLALSQWQPLQSGRWQPMQQLHVSGDVNLLEWQQFHLAKLDLKANIDQGIIQVKPLKAKLWDGNIEASFNWSPAEQALTFSELRLTGLRLSGQDQPLPALAKLQIQQGTLHDVSIIQNQPAWALNHLDLSIQDLQWQRGGRLQARLGGQAGELAIGDTSFDQVNAELDLQPTQWRAHGEANLWEGHVKLSGQYEPDNQKLTVNELTANDWQATLPADWRKRLPDNWPVASIEFRRIEGHSISLLSFDNDWPLSLKGADIFLTDLSYTPAQGLQPISDKLRWETSWGELVYGGLVSRRGDAQGDITHDTYRLRGLRLPLDQGQLTANGEWQRQSTLTHHLSLQVNQLDLDKLNDIFKFKHELSGRIDLNLDLTSQGLDLESARQHLNGQLNLSGKDLYMDKLDLDGYLDAQLENPTPTQDFAGRYPALAGHGTGINQLRLALNAEAGQLQLDGGLATISHLLRLKGHLNLQDASWQSELGVLNAKQCAELVASIQGPWANPQIGLKDAKACSGWRDPQVSYPPQGPRGSLRGD